MIYGEKNPNEKSQHCEKVIQRLQTVRDNWNLFVKENKELQMFAYTQTFKADSYRDSKPIRHQHYQHLTSIFIPLSSCCKFKIIPEVHESGRKAGAIHYHGIIIIKNHYKFYNKCLPFLRTLGHVTIKEIFDMAKWSKYLQKNALHFLGFSMDEYMYEGSVKNV